MMMMYEIGAAVCRDYCADEADLVERLRKALVAAARELWFGDETERVKMACMAALAETRDHAEQVLINRSFHFICDIGAALDRHDFDTVIEVSAALDFKPLPILKLWREIVEGVAV